MVVVGGEMARCNRIENYLKARSWHHRKILNNVGRCNVCTGIVVSRDAIEHWTFLSKREGRVRNFTAEL